MNDIFDTPKEPIRFELPKVPEIKGEFSSLKDIWDDFVTSIKDFKDSITGNTDTKADTSSEDKDIKTDVVEASEYGIKECAEVVKDCFPPEVIAEWGAMDLEQRNEIIQEYAQGIGDTLDLDYNGIIWEVMDDTDGYTFGYSNGDGYIHLNVDIIADPGKLMYLIDTVAHELRHELQIEAIENPGKYPIDDATIKEWTVAREVYTPEMPSAYDPWGYKYNPMETDARHFGESMVRELTKDIINNA